MSFKTQRRVSSLLFAALLLVLAGTVVQTAQAAFVNVSPYCFRRTGSTFLTWGADGSTDRVGFSLNATLREAGAFRDAASDVDARDGWWVRRGWQPVVGGGRWTVAASFDGNWGTVVANPCAVF